MHTLFSRKTRFLSLLLVTTVSSQACLGGRWCCFGDDNAADSARGGVRTPLLSSPARVATDEDVQRARAAAERALAEAEEATKRAAAAKVEADRLVAEKDEADRRAAEKAALEKAAEAQAAAKRLADERAEAERLARVRAAQERADLERLAAAAAAAAEAAAAAQANADRLTSGGRGGVEPRGSEKLMCSDDASLPDSRRNSLGSTRSEISTASRASRTVDWGERLETLLAPLSSASRTPDVTQLEQFLGEELKNALHVLQGDRFTEQSDVYPIARGVFSICSEQDLGQRLALSTSIQLPNPRALYRAFNAIDQSDYPRVAALVRAVQQQNPPGYFRLMGNVGEDNTLGCIAFTMSGGRTIYLMVTLKGAPSRPSSGRRAPPAAQQ